MTGAHPVAKHCPCVTCELDRARTLASDRAYRIEELEGELAMVRGQRDRALEAAAAAAADRDTYRERAEHSRLEHESARTAVDDLRRDLHTARVNLDAVRAHRRTLQANLAHDRAELDATRDLAERAMKERAALDGELETARRELARMRDQLAAAGVST